MSTWFDLHWSSPCPTDRTLNVPGAAARRWKVPLECATACCLPSNSYLTVNGGEPWTMNSSASPTQWSTCAETGVMVAISATGIETDALSALAPAADDDDEEDVSTSVSQPCASLTRRRRMLCGAAVLSPYGSETGQS